MNASDFSWLETLTGMPTVAGHEDRVVSFVRAWAGRRADLRLREDRAGNLHIAQRRRTRTRPLLITAHMDHPGFLVVASAGRDLEVEFRGGVLPAYFSGAKLRVHPPGGSEPILAELLDYDPVSRRGTARAARGAAPVGSLGRWAFPRGSLGVKRGLLHAAGCDDLAGVAAALSFLDRVRKAPGLAHVGLVFTRAEEVGFVGAIAACREGSIRPDARLICLETSRSYPESPIGAGPVIRVGDRVSVFSPDLTNRVSAIASIHGTRIPWQRKLMAGGACEATAFSAFGLESTCVCLPLGNYHNMGNLDEVERGVGAAIPKPEVISLDDHAALISLLVVVSKHLDDESIDVRVRLDQGFDGAVLERRIPRG